MVISKLRGSFGLKIYLGEQEWRSGESTRLQQFVLGSNPGVEAICGLRLILVLSFAPRGFSPGTPVFPSPQKPTFPYSSSTRNQVDEGPISGGATSKSLFVILFLKTYQTKNTKVTPFVSSTWEKSQLLGTSRLMHHNHASIDLFIAWSVRSNVQEFYQGSIKEVIESSFENSSFFWIPHFSATICHHLNVNVHFMTKGDFYSEQVVPLLQQD